MGRASTTKRPPIWVLQFGFCVGIALVIYGSIPLVSWVRSANWQQTAGRVISSDLERVDGTGSDEASYQAMIVYKYTASGAIHYGRRPCFGYKPSSDYGRHKQLIESYPAGSEVTVYYDPRNPLHSVLDRSVEWVVVVSCLFLGFMGCGAVLHNVFGPTPDKEFPEIRLAKEPLAKETRRILQQFARQNVRVRMDGATALSIVVGRGRSKLMLQAAFLGCLFFGFFLFVLLAIKDNSFSRWIFVGLFGLVEVCFVLWLLDQLLVGKEMEAAPDRLILRTRLGPLRWSKTLRAEQIAQISYKASMSSGDIRYFDIRATLRNDRDVRLANGILGEDRVKWLVERIQERMAGAA